MSITQAETAVKNAQQRLTNSQKESAEAQRELEEAIAALEKQKAGRWVPKEGEVFYYRRHGGVRFYVTWTHFDSSRPFHRALVARGNCFKTREEASVDKLPELNLSAFPEDGTKMDVMYPDGFWNAGGSFSANNPRHTADYVAGTRRVRK